MKLPSVFLEVALEWAQRSRWSGQIKVSPLPGTWGRPRTRCTEKEGIGQRREPFSHSRGWKKQEGLSLPWEP